MIAESTLSPELQLPVLRLVRRRHLAHRLAWFVVGAVVLFAVVLIFAPWQQTSFSRGTVVAYAPMDREQVIEAPVKGRVVKWHVVEGQAVEEGQLLVEIADVDPNYSERLETKRNAAVAGVEAAEAEMNAYQAQAEAHEEERKLKIKAAGFKVEQARLKVAAAKQKVEAAAAAVRTAKLDLDRQKSLFDKGLVSKRSLEKAQLEVAKAETTLRASEAGVTQELAAVTASEADLLRADAEGMSKIAKAKAAARKAASTMAEKQSKLAEAEVDISRQRAQKVYAPRAGTLLKVEGNLFGKIVKEGSKLATLMPDTDSRAVALYVKGNDVPLVKRGRRVRLQFEGWPAVQFVGWPSVAVGTFKGRVAFVDAMSQPDGSFRILVVPEEKGAWPSHRLLRQGSKAKGWVLLDSVPLGWELWRQFNGFPPSVNQPVKKKDDESLFGPVKKAKGSSK